MANWFCVQMNICRQCFREKSSDIGFHKVGFTITHMHIPAPVPQSHYIRNGIGMARRISKEKEMGLATTKKNGYQERNEMKRNEMPLRHRQPKPQSRHTTQTQRNLTNTPSHPNSTVKSNLLHPPYHHRSPFSVTHDDDSLKTCSWRFRFSLSHTPPNHQINQRSPTIPMSGD